MPCRKNQFLSRTLHVYHIALQGDTWLLIKYNQQNPLLVICTVRASTIQGFFSLTGTAQEYATGTYIKINPYSKLQHLTSACGTKVFDPLLHHSEAWEANAILQLGFKSSSFSFSTLRAGSSHAIVQSFSLESECQIRFTMKRYLTKRLMLLQ